MAFQDVIVVVVLVVVLIDSAFCVKVAQGKDRPKF